MRFHNYGHHHPGLWFWYPILPSFFFQLSRRRVTIDETQTNLIHLCNFFSPNFRNSRTVNSNTKIPDSIKGSNKTMGKLNIDTYPRPSRETIREYIISRNNDVAIARLLHMHFQDEAFHSHLQNKNIGASGLSILVIISPEN